MDKLTEIKNSLTSAISDDTIDFTKILELANKLAQHDTDNVRFSVDASHISRLGLELVSKQETAVAELIKNAYDADANDVDLIFKDSSEKGGILEIIDNGLGMSREQLLNGFMRISTQDKVLSPVSVKYQRQKAGRKGIGRFATQRLGRQLVISTQLASASESLKLEIDWDLFEGGKDLYLVSNQIKVCPKLPTSGTTLRIESLRDSWSVAQVQRAFRYIADLLQPFPLNEAYGVKSANDSGFKVAFYREENNDIIPIADEERSIFAHSYAIISGRVDDSGIAYTNVISPRHRIYTGDEPLDFDSRIRPKAELSYSSYPLLAGVRFKVYYFIQDELPAGTRNMVREILQRQGGVRVYRNGFRVLPYGEVYDDWLGLQRSSALRELLPPHHNTNFLGFVEISDVTGEIFEETASREGLLENDAFLQLQDFVHRGLMAGVIRLARARGTKVFSTDASSQRNKGKAEQTTPKERAAEIAERLRRAGATDGGQKSNNKGDNSTQDDNFERLASDVEEIGAQSQKILEENGMLRVLASLGLTIGEFTHEVRHAIAALNVTIAQMEAEGVSGQSLLASKDNMLLLQSYVRYFDNAITQNAHRQLDVHELRDLVHEFSVVVRPTLLRQNVELIERFDGYDLFTKPMHKSEWSSIFLNLFTNSLKAIQRAGTKGKIEITGGSANNHLYIIFSDNGDGIRPENVDKIFDAFFSTSSPPGILSSEAERLIGTGLGLKIVKDIIDAADGDIGLIDPPAGYSTSFRIEVPRATDEEIGDAKY